MHLDTGMPVVAAVKGWVELPRRRAVVGSRHGVAQIVGVFLANGRKNDAGVDRADAPQGLSRVGICTHENPPFSGQGAAPLRLRRIVPTPALLVAPGSLQTIADAAKPLRRTDEHVAAWRDAFLRRDLLNAVVG